ncbi:MAG: hypothetical protein M1818_001918 [Claussenomyces sp. TS43310]|nr:MAG: hypothetical protein M1818_001918 [Claussenomyces sp. TS43310]
MSLLDLSHLGNMTAFWPGTNLTSWHSVNGTNTCFGNVTLCLNNDVLCTKTTCDLTLAHFDYLPNVGGNALFAAIFGLCAVGQIGLAIRYKTWGYMVATVLGFIGEIIGYAGRIMLWSDPFSKNDFLIYLVCLTIAPAFLSAAIYLCLARIVVIYGEGISRFRPRWYTIVFCSCDFFSLVLQAAGGAIASTADTASDTQVGINVMLAGLGFQVASLAAFAAACAEFAVRCRSHRESWNLTHASLYESKLFKGFLIGLFVATLTIFIRSVFRCAELSGGFHGPLANNQISFMILEGTMVAIAALCLTILHPGLCFKGFWSSANFKLRGDKNSMAPEKNMSAVSVQDDAASGQSQPQVGRGAQAQRIGSDGYQLLTPAEQRQERLQSVNTAYGR